MDRVRRSLLPESNGKTDEALEVAELASSTALHLFRQRSILQEEWIASFQPGRASLPTLLALGCPPPRGAGHPAAKSEDICSGFSKSSGSSKGSGLTTQASFWGHLPLLNRCYSSILRRCSRGRDAAPPAEDESGAQSDAWPISYQEAQEAWLQAFMELSLAGPRDWPNHRFLRGARTVPTLEMQSERPVTGGPGPLIELLYLIGEKDAQNEAKVLLREPRRQSRGRQAMLDARIAAFCSSACSVPFAFTVLAAVLPQEEDGDGTSPDPTDFLYCTALRFVEAGQKRALCVVSRHPFVEAFGKLLQLLRDGQEALETEVDDAELQGDEGSGGSHTMSNKSSLGAGVNAEVPDEAGEDPSLQRLRRAARRLRHVAPKTRREATRRSRTVPVNQAALEKMPPSPLESRRSYPAKPPALKQEGEDAKLSLENFSYPALSWGPRMGCQEDRRKKAVLLEWAAAQVFRHFTLQDVWELVLALLLEFRIVVVSEAPELASQLVLGLTALLWPFGWQHLLLPICPPYLQGAILDAPVPFICALPAVTSQVATASTAAFTAPRGLGVGAQQGVVVCDADMGVVSLPPGSTTFLRPQLATLQMDANLDASKLLDDTSGAMPRVLKIQKKLMALAEQLSEAHQEVTEDLGSAKWMQEVQAKLSPEPEPFLQAFVNSETCLMFLAVD